MRGAKCIECSLRCNGTLLEHHHTVARAKACQLVGDEYTRLASEQPLDAVLEEVAPYVGVHCHAPGESGSELQMSWWRLE